ncbi:MAG: hypothetical protein ACXVDD_10245, partial [Polyangia bacterium]
MPRALTLVLPALVAVVAVGGCAGTPKVALERAQADAQAGHAAEALRRFDAVAARKDAAAGERIEAL